MKNFTTTDLNLILGVKEGCHFDQVRKPTIVLATLNGQCLKTKKVRQDCNPCYATDLIWATDKNALRKMRCNSTPLKVECYAVSDNNSREKLGYVLLTVRCAQIIYEGEDSKIKMTWHNILGVRNEFNNCKPKLMLYLIIKERNTKITEISSKEKETNNSSNNKALVSHCSQLIFKNTDAIPSLNRDHYYLKEQNHYPNFSNRVQDISTTENILYNNQSNFKSSILDKESSIKNIDIYKTFCLNIKLNSIMFSCLKPDVKIIEFRFYSSSHVIATVFNNVIIEVEKEVKLKNIECSLHFISTSNKIKELLETFSPTINIYDSTFDDKKCLTQVSFNYEKLFEQKKHECQYTQDLRDFNSQNKIGFLEIFAVLEDCTMSLINKMQKNNCGATIVNEFTYKIVDELQIWKERQKEIFKEKLLKKEEAYLTKLNEEWERRRKCFESKLSCGIQQCKVLVNNLNKASKDLRKQKIQCFEKETKLIQKNEELQRKYEGKLRQLQEALEKTQAEFTIKLKTLEQHKSLILQTESLNTKNYELEKVKIDQMDKLNTFEKTFLSEDHTTLILQLKNLEEKLNNAQKSKQFFKEQWDKAVKEINILKIENQKTLESQIKSSKVELHNFDLEEILHADSAALTYDQIALSEIQREIEVINPKSNRYYLKEPFEESLFASV